jgi:hypothetical protein
MNISPVTIGGIALQDFEIPTSIRFGGQQRLVVHRFSDGTRTIERLGPDDSEIRFQGIFSGTGAEARVRALDSLRISGEPVPLVWQSFRYLVILHDFVAEYVNRWWIKYQISCMIVDHAFCGSDFRNTLQESVSSDLASAAAVQQSTAVDISEFTSVVSVAGALTVGTAANTQACAAALTTLNSAGLEVTQQAAVMASAGQDYADPVAAASSFQQQLAAAQALASAVVVQTYLSRISTTLNSLDQ